ncbi:hypothetical protein J6590_056499 [Homalodisca vitripennis]|nr:hypothetical protein J6590_056499 [Homalodisca vitripennis]
MYRFRENSEFLELSLVRKCSKHAKLINDSLHEMGQWVQETFPVDTGNSSSSHTSVSHRLWYDIRDLEESSVFQAQLQVRNRYGWSDLSDVYQFYTRAPNEDVVEHNMELLSSRGLLLQHCLLLTVFACCRFVL